MKQHIMKKFITLIVLAAPITLLAQNHAAWRAATPDELSAALPARAPVEKERIETEMRTASGIIDTHNHLIAGVVLITAGYSADGKYSHYLLVQSPITISNIALAPGSYVFGWRRNNDDTLTVSLYDAATGAPRGTAIAHRLVTGARVESFRIFPPADHAYIQIGRFSIPYTLGE